MLLFDKAEVLLEDGCYEAQAENCGYRLSDIHITAKEDGGILVSGGSTPVCEIRLTVKNTYFDGDALVLGDAWERAYGDLCWQKPEYAKKLPWYFIACEAEKIYGFGVKTLPNSLCCWQCDGNMITLNIDVRNGRNGIALNGRTIEACRIVTGEFEGDAHKAACEFCVMMCDRPAIVNRPIFGGNDWYCNYGDNSFDKIITHTRRIAQCASGCEHKPYMVIDDGWELCHSGEEGDGYFNGGPWRYCNGNFPDMKTTAEEIERAGAIPGIWLRPLWSVEKLPPESILKREGIKVTLDPSSPIVIDMVKKDIMTVCEWGYKLIKHDFSTFDIFGGWGFEMKDGLLVREGEFFDKTKTNAEIVKNLYYAIREAAGDDVLIMGCNTISHLSAGIFDIQRTGDDTSGIDWERTKKYGINTLAFRMAQHNAFYCADADCVGITGNIGFDKNRQWLDVLSKSGTALFVSIAEDAYTDEVKEAVTQAFKRADENRSVSYPLDWMENTTPSVWKSAYGTDEYCW